MYSNLSKALVVALLPLFITACGRKNSHSAGLSSPNRGRASSSRLNRKDNYSRRDTYSNLIIPPELSTGLRVQGLSTSRACLQLVFSPKNPSILNVTSDKCPLKGKAEPTSITFQIRSESGVPFRGKQEILFQGKAVGSFQAQTITRAPNVPHVGYVLRDLCSGDYHCRLEIVGESLKSVSF